MFAGQGYKEGVAGHVEQYREAKANRKPGKGYMTGLFERDLWMEY